MAIEDLEPYQFKPGKTGNPNGRPRKIFTIIKESGYTKDDIRVSFEQMGWQNLEDLQAILDDDTKPVILKVIARAFIKGAERGDFRYVSEILTHVMGKPKEQIESKNLHKIIVEYVRPEDTVIPPSSSPTEDIE